MLEQALNRIDALDLTRLHNIIAFLGMMLSVYVMVLTSHEREDRDDPLWLQWGRRVAYALVACGYLWSLSYSATKRWEPWPPEILLMIGIMSIMTVRVVAIHIRIWRTGHRFPPPIPAKGVASRQRLP